MLARMLYCPSMHMLVVAALLLGLAPFTPEPHLVEKARMLMQGELTRPLDIFDVFWHSWPLLWIVLRLLTPPTVCEIPNKS
ncbi:MAG: hypothetical protein CO186_09440 [Zetaproteobacteria bacterium CG_4_9_14_3_um_filter_49_83]|nr:MAG: hypothetical protein AUJ56_12910 [Zetaproteobacteria bacterium CG1_02_49_23]PIQ30902.1 MAG: hypothetical protein COW62_11025 [Zetaproteobacteria bacterium CG17_big_fil_post_rev_8_21_14_2_50_50_13]PIV30829.1 MAG: hypothetical protein COS35_04455 [Zetaproteobacteria bacterium CG02_land_8_20_14_3_00_50_9]PIY56221.1 MAG: hypothetical protein COZ00_05290 [Zetaproteobacteria bacterium CG_4_10_14_0_8_um_filter_49_80]PJA34704.1 MAG: hypothetical protein CO186_09440 [Zetaproteobacteria bacterium